MGEIPEVSNGLVEISLADHPAGIEISAVWSHQERGQGHASRAMRSLVAAADELETRLVLSVHWLAYELETTALDDLEIDRLDLLNQRRLSTDQLASWYEHLGFEDSGRTDGDDKVMVYEPKPPARRRKDWKCRKRNEKPIH